MIGSQLAGEIYGNADVGQCVWEGEDGFKKF